MGLAEGDYLFVDDASILTDRIVADEPYYSMNHKRRGMNPRSSHVWTGRCGFPRAPRSPAT